MNDYLLPLLEPAVEMGALDEISGIAPDDLLLLTPWVQIRDVLALRMGLAQIRGKLNNGCARAAPSPAGCPAYRRPRCFPRIRQRGWPVRAAAGICSCPCSSII